ncbi:MFS monocarboxylate transporter [Colletotrichum truncatum]|uniref:MFS monocarboxylate transporter n=1 Tax=Colletotrichum truncatum TaxID=5467 RepID=A0ACC3YLQ6_COLTU|nr:MFS monocarboxylate transporter [Colletotrichum truncatum]KAF6781839.1 MFS monocarboxylate transporter [Colletotrichum truncatum]
MSYQTIISMLRREKEQANGAEKTVQHTNDNVQTQYETDMSHSDPEQAAPITPKETYPEGGKAAYLVVLGSFSAIMGGLGLMNSIGIYQSWISSHQLQDVGEGKRGWIFGLYNFMVFFCGIQIGPVFDVYGPTWLMVGSLVLYVATFASLGFCEEYWHFLVVVGLVAGAATSIVFVVPVATLGQYFNVKRGAATGLAMAGGSLGGVMYPLVFDALSDDVGFAWTTRAIGLITVVLLLVGCVLVRPRKAFYKSKPADTSILPDFRILLRPAVLLMTVGVFFIEWGFFIGLEYVASYSLAHGISQRLSYLMVVFLNAGSFPGRWLPGFVADRFGRMKTMIVTNALCIVAMLAIWLPANGNVVAVVIFSVVFGFASGSNISLVPVCVGEYCSTENYGRYYSTVYTVVSLGALTGVPIAGEILARSGGGYSGLIIFAGVAYVAGTICFVSLVIFKKYLS